jgi:adsorption protein B
MVYMDNVTLLMWYFLIATGCFYVVLGLDDAFFDIIYWVRHFYNKIKHRIYGYRRLSIDELLKIPEKPMAIFIGCWDEHAIIEIMLKHNIENINYNNYDIFVGLYPNDPKTIDAVKKAALLFPNLHYVIGNKPGPTTKSHNLNTIFEYIKTYEKEHNKTYDVFVMHDAEDLIHPLSLKVFNYMIPRKDMVQLPVYPLRVDLLNFTHWVYNDEFIESHTKDMIVRETIDGHVPSAGVGTGFSRRTLYALEKENKGVPFHNKTHTEDYSISLQIRRLNLESIFMRHSISQIVEKKRWYLFGFGKPVHKEIKQHVVTQSLFPNHYYSAVRQRSRWILGISLQEWQHSQWKGNLATKMTLFRDRKGLVAYLVTGIAYALRVYWISHVLILTPLFPNALTLVNLLEMNRGARYLVVVCTVLMFNRILQRMISTTRIYGIIPGILSIPRVYWSNIINFHAVILSLKVFFLGEGQGGRNKWLKTRNSFPSHEQRAKHKRRLGDLLMNKGLTTTDRLTQALQEQTQTHPHQHLGDILLNHHWVEEQQLLHVLAEQHETGKIDILKQAILLPDALVALSAKEYAALIKSGMLPISLTSRSLLIACSKEIEDKQQHDIKKKMYPRKVHFIKITPQQKGKLVKKYQQEIKTNKK